MSIGSDEGLLLVLVGLGSLLVGRRLWLILPIVSWMRVSRLKRELADVQGRLAALESAEAQRLAARLKASGCDAPPGLRRRPPGSAPEPPAPAAFRLPPRSCDAGRGTAGARSRRHPSRRCRRPVQRPVRGRGDGTTSPRRSKTRSAGA